MKNSDIFAGVIKHTKETNALIRNIHENPEVVKIIWRINPSIMKNTVEKVGSTKEYNRRSSGVIKIDKEFLKK